MTDGTSVGTQLLKDINPGAGSSFPNDFTALGNKLLFQADDGASGNELWVTDGAGAGTQLLKDINPGVGNSDPFGLIVLGDKVLFRATDATHGRELWVTDGTAAGTQLLKDINVFSTNNSNPSFFTILDDHTFKGTPGKDTVTGTNDFDFLFGLAGNDRILGLDGDDVLTGGKGRDLMTGGLGHDIFDFNAIKESGIKVSTRDVISDFKHGQDKIDVFDIDAITGTAKNDKFHFIGTAGFHNVKGELHFVLVDLPGKAHDITLVGADVTGDGVADFEIQLKGLIHLTKGDFIL